MRLVRRGLWIAAWGAWVWLGAGLAVHLPQEVGPAVCRLPLEPNELPIGFIGDGKLVTFWFSGATESSVVRRWDARSGALEQEIGGPPFDQGPMSFDLSPDNRLLAWGVATTHRQDWRSAFSTSRKGRFTPSDQGRHIFDLVNGMRSAIPDGAGVTFHPDQPWVAYWLRGDDATQYVTLVDVNKGRTVAEWKGPRLAGRKLAINPWFAGPRSIAIPVWRSAPRVPPKQRELCVEIWDVDADHPRVTIRGGPAFGPMMAGTPNRLAWYGTHGSEDTIEVADITAGRIVFTEPTPNSKRTWGNGEPALAEDGSTVLSVATNRLFDIASGRLLWSAHPDEHVTWNDGGRRFEVSERWCVPYTTRVLLQTYAVRDLRDGRFLWRSWEPTLQRRGADAHGELLIVGGEVCTLPLRVNYPLLALCQSILALPLLLLWLTLLWRQKRRERRLAGVTA